MSISKIRLIICGFALILLGINIAIVSHTTISYIFSGLGLVLIISACFENTDENEDDK